MSKRKPTPPRPKQPGDADFMERVIQAAKTEMPDGYGCIILAMPFGEDGVLRYASDIRREDALNVLKEWMLKCGAEEDWMKHIK